MLWGDLMKPEARSVVEDVSNRIWPIAISDTHYELAEKIGERAVGMQHPDLKSRFGDPRKFSVGEMCPKFAIGGEGQPKDLQGKSVYLIMTPGPYKEPEALIERANIWAFAAKENGAEKVVLLATELPHSRQDRGPDEDEKATGEPNTVRSHARGFEAQGVDQIITTHEHSPRIAAFYAVEYGLVPRKLLLTQDAPKNPRDWKAGRDFDPNDPRIQECGRAVFKNLSPHAILADYILHQSSLVGSKYLEDGGVWLALKAMDNGNAVFTDLVFEALFLPFALRLYCNKDRSKKNDPSCVKVDITRVKGEHKSLEGKLEINADDGGDTCGTLIDAANKSQQGNVCLATGEDYGVPEDRLVYATHPWFGGQGFMGIQHRLVKSLPAREIVTTNTRPYISDGQDHRFKMKSTIIRFAYLWADAIVANELKHDLSKRYSDFASEQEQHFFVQNLYAIKRHSWHFLTEGSEPEKRQIKFFLR